MRQGQPSSGRICAMRFTIPAGSSGIGQGCSSRSLQNSRSTVRPPCINSSLRAIVRSKLSLVNTWFPFDRDQHRAFVGLVDLLALSTRQPRPRFTPEYFLPSSSA